MNAKELRIGNYCMENEVVTKCSHLSPKVVITEAGYPIGVGYSDIEPIPLTEEWLEKFGFEIEEYIETGNKIATKKFKEYYSPFALLQLKGWKYYTFTTNAGNGVNEYCKDIKYVHQLQNLYFALTGEELTAAK